MYRNVARIVWDEPKRLSNLATRGMDFASLDREFFLASVLVPSRDRRFKAVGWFDGEPLTVIFRPLGTEAV